MNDKFTPISIPNSRTHRAGIAGTQFRCAGGERGAVMPVAIGLGLIASLLAGIMLARSHNDRTNVVMRDAIARSEAIAELAVTHYQNLINENREIATLDACQTWSNGSCSDADGVDTWATNPAVPDQEVSQQWQAVDADDIEEGQFRLINYNYDVTDPDNPIGRLTVEGRVNVGEEGAEGTGTTVRRLQVTFPVTPGAPTNFPGAGLWISCNADSSVSNSTSYIYSNIKDSSDPSPSSPCHEDYTVENLKDHQPPNDPEFTYEENSEDAFPSLPPEGELAQIPAGEVCTITGVPMYNAATLPQDANDPSIIPCDEGPGEYYNYYLNTSQALHYTGPGDILTVDAPGKQVKLYLNGSFTITHGDAGVTVTPGTTLIIYAHNEVRLTGGSNIGGPLSNSGTADNLQIYQYTDIDVKLTGGSNTNAFVFAPFARVSMTGASAITGAIWAKSYHATGGSDFISSSNINCANMSSGICTDSGGSNQIGAITSWEVIEAYP